MGQANVVDLDGVTGGHGEKVEADEVDLGNVKRRVAAGIGGRSIRKTKSNVIPADLPLLAMATEFDDLLAREGDFLNVRLSARGQFQGAFLFQYLKCFEVGNIQIEFDDVTSRGINGRFQLLEGDGGCHGCRPTALTLGGGGRIQCH